MADLKFNCPHCQQSLEAPEEMLGQQINCPSCNGAITLPNPESKQTATPPPPPPQTRVCPYCGEEILPSAVKCKHCGEFLDGRNREVVSAPPSEPQKPQAENEIWKGNPSYLYYFGDFFFCGFFLLISVIGIFSHFLPSELLPLPIVLGLFSLLRILYAFLDRNTKVYALTNKRAMCKIGIISRKIHEVGTKDIRNINLHQGIFARLFGVGTVEIESAAAAGQGHVRFMGVKDPLSVRDVIRREKDEADSR